MLYQPPHFAIGQRDLALALMRRHPLATIVSAADGGEPMVSHAPLVPDVRGEDLALHGHLAKPNPQWKQWRDGDGVLAIFHGPDAYVSPFCYAAKEAVPTWNYAVVHALGTVTLAHDSADRRLPASFRPRIRGRTPPSSAIPSLPGVCRIPARCLSFEHTRRSTRVRLSNRGCG